MWHSQACQRTTTDMHVEPNCVQIICTCKIPLGSRDNSSYNCFAYLYADETSVNNFLCLHAYDVSLPRQRRHARPDSFHHGRPHSTNVCCHHDIGRESWERERQESVVWQAPTPPKWGSVPHEGKRGGAGMK